MVSSTGLYCAYSALSPAAHAGTLSPRLSNSRNRGAGRLHTHAVDRGVGGEKHGLIIGATPRTVGRIFWQADDANPFARGVEYPASAGTSAVDATLTVHLHTVGDAVRGVVGGHIGEASSVRDGAVRAHVVGQNILTGTRVGDI